MVQTFFWYDLETTGVNPRDGRVMQFAGQRTDLNLKPVGEPVNVLVKLTDDVLPEPDAVMITGITPQATIADGVTEVEFLKNFYEEVATPGTIFVGFNTVRFDDEWLRYMNYRNFYDAYQWQWQDGRSRWDLLDVVRMTRALRPDGIEWPVDAEGKPTNRLELLTKANGLVHEHAHDALNDVIASIAVAQLIKDKQPKLFDWLLNIRDKKKVAELVEGSEPFVYTSGKYANEFEKTTVVVRIAKNPNRSGVALVYDLRHDPTEFLGLSPSGLADRWRWNREPDAPSRLPVKTLQYNRCPAVAPLGVMKDAPEKVRFPLPIIEKNRKLLAANPDFVENVLVALDILDAEQEERNKKPQPVDAQLYDGFFDQHDGQLLPVVRAAKPEELAELGNDLHDMRLKEMLPLYKARNYPKLLSDEERVTWEKHRYELLMEGGTQSRLSKFIHRLQELSETEKDTNKCYLIEELQLYAESIMPVLDFDAGQP